MRRHVVLAAVIYLLTAVTVHAQSITQVIHTVYAQGNTTAQQTPAVLTFTAFQCGQKPKIVRPTTTVDNPTKIIVDDPADATADCIFTAGVTADGGLFSLPFGTQVYESTTKYVNSVATGPESVRSNLFTHRGAAPPAPTGTRIVRALLSTKTVFGFRTRRASPRFLYLAGDRRGR